MKMICRLTPGAWLENRLDVKTLTAELDGGQCLAMRPHLKQLVTEQLRTVRQQLAEFQL